MNQTKVKELAMDILVDVVEQMNLLSKHFLMHLRQRNFLLKRKEYQNQQSAPLLM